MKKLTVAALSAAMVLVSSNVFATGAASNTDCDIRYFTTSEAPTGVFMGHQAKLVSISESPKEATLQTTRKVYQGEGFEGQIVVSTETTNGGQLLNLYVYHYGKNLLGKDKILSQLAVMDMQMSESQTSTVVQMSSNTKGLGRIDIACYRK